MFTDKETNNWFKASIALNVTKQGLTNFLDKELQNVHALVGRSCGNCPIEKLIPCPTNPYCNKRNRNSCPFHKSQKPQQCPPCDNVKQNITSQHRYGGPSWRNTRAEQWALNYWEIGKCYLPPDGYSSVSSVQETDFNGMISIMLNCLHFQTCLSVSCLSPPPPDKLCPLEKARQIGRDVRHTSDCKVTDADLQDFFKTLSTLLADQNYLQNDPFASIARTRLSDLQNDRMSIEELGELLKEAYQTLKHAKEAGERFSEDAERTLAKAIERIQNKTRAAERRLKCQTHAGQELLKSITKVGAQSLESKAHVGAERIESNVQRGEERLESKAQRGEERIESKAQRGEERIDSKAQRGEELIERKAQRGEERIESKAQRGEERIESKAQRGEERIDSKAQRGEERIESKVQRGEERLENHIQHGDERLESKTQRGEERLESKAHDVEQCIETTIQNCKQRIEYSVQDGIMRMQETANKTAKEDYEQSLADFRDRLIKFYTTMKNNVSVSPLKEGLDKPIWDVFVQPKLSHVTMKKDGSRKKTENPVHKYKAFFTEIKS